jgi:predicted O-methyltransferase YrrM
MNLYHVVSVIRHLLTSRRNGYARTHDPFLNNFVTTVLRDRTPVDMVQMTEKLREELLHDHRYISVTDLGTGRRGLSKRKVSDIASRAAVTPPQAALLARIAASEMTGYDTNGGVIVELGTSLGISTLCLSAAAPQSRIITIEGCPVLNEMAKENLRRFVKGNIRHINADFSDALKIIKKEGIKVRFAYIDGNHTGEALEEYFNTLMEMADDEITVVADDIHLNRSMHHGWQTIKRDNRIELTVETIRFGILFRNQSVASGSLRIRC